MKKLAVYSTLLVTILALTACGNRNTQNNPNQPPTNDRTGNPQNPNQPPST
jgi:ABC-type Fe3+-citrate transport system substrate-binding protein